ncbi:enoyl-CoA hydratase/isomerase family protein [Siccirubricoccus phaeus]|uniref:enoyl-CoA hydratase/isomerase family protein n=1 Tax=Siccirubricoccus phaeus TaxID=2595053 RepID=UPI0011F282BE|nr:enoyl-CoA hydratase/isomerase family protein [Siccirubricoccus phaeus]
MSELALPDCEGLTLRLEEGVLTVVFDRPAKRNAITLAMYRTLTAIFAAAAEMPKLRAIVLRGADGCFSAGADIGDLAEGEGRRLAMLKEHRRISDTAVEALAACRKPSVALIEGYCLGGAMAFAMACDFRIAAPGASLGIPASHLGVVYSYGDCRRLQSLVGLPMAKRILFLGDRMQAEEALACGLVDEVAADAPAAAAALVAALLRRAPLSIAGMKLALDVAAAGEGMLRADAVTAAAHLAMASRDMQEATAAFLAKRPPHFTGS